MIARPTDVVAFQTSIDPTAQAWRETEALRRVPGYSGHPVEPAEGQEDATDKPAHIGLFFDGYNMDGDKSSSSYVDPNTHQFVCGGFATTIYKLFKFEYPNPGDFHFVDSVKHYYNTYTAHAEAVVDQPTAEVIGNWLGIVAKPRNNIQAAFRAIQEEWSKRIYWKVGNASATPHRCANIRIDIFGFSWGAIQALELAWMLKAFPLMSEFNLGYPNRSHYAYEYAQVRFLGVFSPVDFLINGTYDDEVRALAQIIDRSDVPIDPHGAMTGAPFERTIADLSMVAKEEADGWDLPHSFSCPTNVEHLFQAYKDPRVPEWGFFRAMAFQWEKRITRHDPTKDLSNQERKKTIGGEYTYLSNHSQFGGLTKEAIEAGRDLWRAWATAALFDPEGAAWKPPGYVWERRDRLNWSPRTWWRPDEVPLGIRARSNAKTTRDYRTILEGQFWPFGSPISKHSYINGSFFPWRMSSPLDAAYKNYDDCQTVPPPQ